MIPRGRGKSGSLIPELASEGTGATFDWSNEATSATLFDKSRPVKRRMESNSSAAASQELQ